MTRRGNLLFAAGYGLLGVCVFMAVAGFVLGLTSLNKASKHSVQVLQAKVNPGAEQAYKDACATQVQGAAASGVTLVQCKLADPKEVGLKHNPNIEKGQALVALAVQDSTGQHYVVFVEMNNSAWTQTNYKVTPLAKGLATIEEPR